MCDRHVAAAHYDDEKALRTALLDNYEPAIRPDRKVTVTVSLSLLSVNVLDVPLQRLSVSGWLSFTWHDPRLSWDPVSFGNITDIFDTELVFWRPEIIVDNSVNNLGILESDKLLIRATSQGNMTWEPPGIFETHCDVDVTFYPFDAQVCVVEVTSWAQTMQQIDLYASSSKIDLADYEESGEWDVLGSWTDRRLLTDGADTHSEVTFSIKLLRKPMYYVTTILIPVMVTSILCIVVFLLPAESGEKVGYSLTILLTYTVMLTLVASYMPPTSKHTSVLSVYLTIILFIGVFTTLITVVVLHLHHRSRKKLVPTWLHFLVRTCMLPLTSWRPRHLSDNDPVPKGHVHGQPQLEQQQQQQTMAPGSRSRVFNTYDGCSTHDRTRDSASAVANRKHATELSQNHGLVPDGNVPQTSSSRAPLDNRYQFTWQEVGVILDALCLRILGVFVLALTLIVLLTMVIGGSVCLLFVFVFFPIFFFYCLCFFVYVCVFTYLFSILCFVFFTCICIVCIWFFVYVCILCVFGFFVNVCIFVFFVFVCIVCVFYMFVLIVCLGFS
ncbi:unnamed protein product [Candidula unifasciata]|uniref:Uncharacterized protein n=1 Tax=Candidula unifasciata TaxID=100452 RepID=A0A8S3ZHB8_9EUPU|nr:unnamed protein product [Candidula unifasciata]